MCLLRSFFSHRLRKTSGFSSNGCGFSRVYRYHPWQFSLSRSLHEASATTTPDCRSRRKLNFALPGFSGNA
eukprot:scaffold418138_cov42-Prasinocladus_malaysianus.AAC.1